MKPEERGNLFPAIEVPSQRDGTCCWQPQALTRLKAGPTMKKRRRWTPQQTWKQENCFTSSRGGQSYLGGFPLPPFSDPRSQQQQAYCIFWFCFPKIFDKFRPLYFLNNCECFSSFLSDTSWQPKCFALDWSCLCQIQHFTHLHQSQRVGVILNWWEKRNY